MPEQIDHRRAQGLSPRLDEALEIVCNEFEGLDTDRQYRNAFSRLLRVDPLRRVMMMGTDSRDLFVPLLRRAIENHVPAGGHIFDFGAGDGQSFALVADAVPDGTTVSVEEPNSAYLADYVAFLERQPHLRGGIAISAVLEELEEAASRSGIVLPEAGSVDLALGLHMLYFVPDPLASIERMLRFVKQGGAFFTVIADLTTAYQGVILREFIEAGGETGENQRHLAGITEHRRLLAPMEEGGGGLVEELRAADILVEVSTVRQPSRLYGHTLADLLALGNIGELAHVAGSLKFEVAARTLRDRSEEIDLRIETKGPRLGMWSVTQPQWVTQVSRLA
ncbi:MAG: class I SAM-dependent methyltransferase [Mycobacterium sp.]